MRDRSILEQAFEQYKIARNYPISICGIYSIATNDADYVTWVKETLPNGKQKLVWKCPVYATWHSMLERGYSQKLKDRFPTYQNVTVCEEWLVFSNFRDWWVENNVRNWHLEKDLLIKGNLIYSPDTCAYMPPYLNTLLTDSAATRGDYPLGVYRVNELKPYRSKCWVGGKNKHLGLFQTPLGAHRVWQVAKIDCIKDAIAHYIEDANRLCVFDQRIITALNGRISILQDDVDNGRETLVLH